MQVPHPHDVKWFEEEIKKIPQNMRYFAEEKYKEVFRETYEKHEGKISQLNLARKEANERLRLFVDKVTTKG